MIVCYRLGNYLVILFVMSKIFYIANAIMQLFMLSAILSISYNNYGFDIMRSMVADHDWTEADHVAFPRVTMCDFNVRRLGNVHRYTVQCVLPINLYNEKIYIFLWFWLVFVAVVSLLSFLTWVLRFMMRSDRLKFVRNHLKLGDRITSPTHEDRDLSAIFLNNYLKQDGAFLLRLIAHNTNNITTTEVTCALWDIWREKRAARQKQKGLDEPDTMPGSSLYPDPHAADTLELKEPITDKGDSMA